MTKSTLHRLACAAKFFAIAILWCVKISAAQKVWTGEAGDTLWSTAGNWSPAGFPLQGDNVTFTNIGVGDTMVDSAFGSAINSLAYRNIQGSFNTILLNPLTVVSSSPTDVAFLADDGQPSVFFIGSGQADGAADEVYAAINGSLLYVTNITANLSVMQASATNGAHRATLDLTGLELFTCYVSNVLVGHDFGVPITRPTGTLILGTANSITAKLISVADAYQNAGGTSFIHLGQENKLNVDRIRIALHKCNGTIDMQAGLAAPTVTFRDSGGSDRALSWEIGDEYEPADIGYFTSSQSNGTMDLTGASVDALVDRITLGRGQTNAPTRTGDGNGTLTFGGGTVDVNTLEMGIQLSGGGSVGRGTLNINNDDSVGPGSLVVRSNVVMAVQLAGNTETTGSAATITLNGGHMSVAGHIIDGGGNATININAGGVLDLKPEDDTTAGNISVDVLNIADDGVVTNYNTLSASTIALIGAATQFTVYSGQTISPASGGTLNIAGDLMLRGTARLSLAKAGATLSASKITSPGKIDLGGTLQISATGDALAAGDKFVLFSAPTLLNAFTTINFPPVGSNLSWTNRIATDGSIEVIPSGEPVPPPSIAITDAGTSVTISWPPGYTDFILTGQTNPITVGISAQNWGPVPGVVGNQVTIQKNAANGTVFFRLAQQ